MKIIDKGNTNIAQLIRKKSVENEKFFRLSNFAYLFSKSGHHLIKYTLTNALIELSNEEWRLINKLKDDKIIGNELQESDLLYLAENCILVEYDFDEYKHYSLAIHVLKTMSSGKNKGVKSYTILPTTVCNARCVYCYEEGMKFRTMTQAIADSVVDFIDKTRREDNILINWFGGEPLVAQNIIQHICDKLNEHSVSFNSKIITNATLLTRELVKQAKQSWHLESAQVSVDGNRHDYELRKRYCNPSIHNYDAMMNAISFLLNEDIKVNIRCNYDGENLAGIKDFIEELNTRFGTNTNFSIYFAMLFQENESRNSIELRKEIVNIIRHYRSIGMNFIAVPYRDCQFRINYCMADSNGKHVVIDPDGFLYHCEHLTAPENVSFGHISGEDFNITSDNRVLMNVHEKCRQCCFLPYCTPFFRNACPNWSKYCYNIKCVDIDFILEQAINKEYSV